MFANGNWHYFCFIELFIRNFFDNELSAEIKTRVSAFSVT